MTALSEYVSTLARARTAQGHTDGWIITASWDALREYLGRNPRHCDIATTQIYLASISTEAMRRYNDLAASLILKADS